MYLIRFFIMGIYSVLFGTMLGSIVTIIVQYIVNYFSDEKKHKRELNKIVFVKKIETIEKAMSWYQEALDCYAMLRSSCNELNTKYSDFSYNKLCHAGSICQKLFSEASNRLNHIYLYYSFNEINNKYDSAGSIDYINFALAEISRLNQSASSLRNQGFTDDSKEILQMRNKAIDLLAKMISGIDVQIAIILEIQNVLRADLSQYNK